MTAATALPLPVLVAIGSALVAPLLAWAHRRLPLIIGIIALLTATALMGFIDADVLDGNGSVVTHYFGGEVPFLGKALGIAFAADPFGAIMATVTAGIGSLLLLSLLSEIGRAHV